MKKLILQILTIAALFFVMDRVLGLGLKSLYSVSNATDEYKISYSAESTQDPLLFFGSSRCLHHYAPTIIQQQLGLPCFNTADWGIKNIYFHYGLLGNILTRYTPQTIVFEIHPCDWLDTPFSGIERAASLAPYCGMSEPCDEMLKLTGYYWPCMLSHVYRYTGSLPTLLTGKLGSMDRSLKGWKPLEGVLDTTGVVAEEYPFPIDQQRVTLLERFIQDCLQHHIRLIMIESPMYVCSREDVFRFPRELAAKYKVPFLDHYRDPDFVGHADLFFDFGHLNRQGAERYSAKIAKELKTLLP
ncbi:MAG: hypothetical protein K6G32_09820 [Prevotella sp.]|jgi:hypothetical protein|nr:hypothetical protein [Prevotella sp.]